MGHRKAASQVNISPSVLGKLLKIRGDINCEALKNGS